MKLTLDGPVARVTLSRRNLLTLLNKLSDPESKRTLVKKGESTLLLVTAEEDDLHYKDRPEGEPGEVHPKHNPTLLKEAA
jgi:hypothetical protein